MTVGGGGPIEAGLHSQEWLCYRTPRRLRRNHFQGREQVMGIGGLKPNRTARSGCATESQRRKTRGAD